MNDQHLDLVFRNYIDRFAEMNGPGHNEAYKWEAVQHFQDHWNLDADDFAAMLRKSLGATGNLIDNRVVQPSAGLLELARHDPEALRTLFRELFADDSGDLKRRQDQIDAFVSSTNEQLVRQAPGKWKLEQDTRATIAYLSLYHPDDNYLYKATPARIFGRCVGFGHEIGSGSDFRLGQYYNLCDWLVEAIRRNPELIEVHRKRLGPHTHADEQFHILAYDIIYCAQGYGLYGDIDIRSSSRRRSSGTGRTGSGPSIRRNRQKEELQARLIERQNRLDAIRSEINFVGSRLAELGDLPLIGLEVQHRRFGAGLVIGQDHDIITVRFAHEERRFALPCAFTDHFLTTADGRVNQIFEIITRVLKEQQRLERERQLIASEAI